MTNFRKLNEFIRDKQAQKDYNDEIVRKTWHYQNKYGFKTSSKKGNEFWNNEADAFKHAFLSADLFYKYGDIGSTILGIAHEYQTPKNPLLEWNMDSWNNNQGREIAREIRKEYGDKFKDFPRQKQEDIIAAKVVYRMRNGDLITKPTDPRKYNGKIENIAKNHPEILKQLENFSTKGQPTGQAAGIEHIFTPEEIGKMSPEEFNKYENTIMEQARAGKIVESSPKYTTPGISPSPNVVLYTREDIGNMTTKEYTKHEDAIKQQMKTIGIPYNKDVPKGTKTYGKEKASHNSSSSTEDGRWVTINGNHVYIED